MKNGIKLWMTAFVFLMFVTGCTNDTSNTVNPNEPNLNIPTSDGWHVTWFWDQDKDETSDFSGYTFFFRSNGVFEANNSSGSVTGTWSITTDDGTQRLVLFISELKPLSELNDDWIITESDDISIQLKDDNDEHLEEVIFERE